MVTQTVKNLPAMQKDSGLIAGLGRSPGEGNGYPLQYSCLENPMDRAWWHRVYGVSESDMTEQLTHKHIIKNSIKDTDEHPEGEIHRARSLGS